MSLNTDFNIAVLSDAKSLPYCATISGSAKSGKTDFLKKIVQQCSYPVIVFTRLPDRWLGTKAEIRAVDAQAVSDLIAEQLKTVNVPKKMVIIENDCPKAFFKCESMQFLSVNSNGLNISLFLVAQTIDRKELHQKTRAVCDYEFYLSWPPSDKNRLLAKQLKISFETYQRALENYGVILRNKIDGRIYEIVNPKMEDSVTSNNAGVSCDKQLESQCVYKGAFDPRILSDDKQQAYIATFAGPKRSGKTAWLSCILEKCRYRVLVFTGLPGAFSDTHAEVYPPTPAALQGILPTQAQVEQLLLPRQLIVIEDDCSEEFLNCDAMRNLVANASRFNLSVIIVSAIRKDNENSGYRTDLTPQIRSCCDYAFYFGHENFDQRKFIADQLKVDIKHCDSVFKEGNILVRSAAGLVYTIARA